MAMIRSIKIELDSPLVALTLDPFAQNNLKIVHSKKDTSNVPVVRKSSLSQK